MSDQSWPRSLPHSSPHGLETEHRITKLEVKSEDHGSRITILERVLWALLISVSAMGHEKLPRLLDFVDQILKAKP